MTHAAESPAPALLEEMFVHTARSVSSTDGSLTLHGLNPATLYFSDRPERVVGHMTTEQFVQMWSQGPNSFLEDPPNAVLSWVEKGQDTPADAVVVLRDPVIEQESITYAIEVLDGAVPATGGAVSLFIDPFGRPLSPVSVAGVRRRERRREFRRF
ncbi:hypothetical protein [Nakamurella sp.]|uniref:hypothetical protein n=1 Tax=Nakamurella sp. TaxID=1869182 RepID=UPI003B3AECC7